MSRRAASLYGGNTKVLSHMVVPRCDIVRSSWVSVKQDFLYKAFRCASLFSLASFLFLPNIVGGQVLPFHNYSTRDGLPSNRITALCQDSKGFLWIGTDEGLSVYDGEAFKTYTTNDGLVNNFITSIIESKQSPGTMWIGSIAGGISRYKDGSFTPIKFGSYIPKTFIGNVLEDQQGTIWCMTTNGVFKVSGDTLQHFPIHPPEYINGNDMVLASDGKIWFGVNRRVYIYSPTEQKTNVINLDLQPGAFINRMKVDREGDIWIIGKDSTLRMFVGDRLHTLWHSSSQGIVTDLILDRDGDLWITSTGGLCRIPKKDFPRGQIVINFGTQTTAESYLEQILEDREGDIWFGGFVTGLHKLSEKNVVTLQLSNEVVGFPDRKGHLWLMNSQGAWECWKNNDGVWSTVNHRLLRDRKAVQIGSIRSDTRGRLWIQYSDSTLECDSIITRERGPSLLRKSYTFKAGKDFPALIWMFYVDPQNYLWLSLGIGIEVIDLNASPPKVITLLRQEDELRMSSIRAIYRDSKSDVWFGSFSEGLVKLVGGDLTLRDLRHFTTNEGLPDNGVRSLAEDDYGRLWIGTRFGGVAIYDGTKFRTISIKEGLLSNAVWAITKDEQHHMWLGTGGGAMSVNIDNLKELRWSEVMTKEPCGVYYSTMTKNIWIVNTKEAIGLGDKRTTGIAPPVHITNITINDRLIDVRGGMEFPHDQNNVIIDYVGLSFKNEQAVRYQYRLKGIDSAWGAPSRQRLVTYAALSPGSYTFEVIAVNGDGISSSTPASFSFSIVPPIWQRWWFVVLVVASVASVTYGVFRRKVVSLEQRRVMQEEFSRRLIESQESERTRIAAELHDSLGQNLLVIKNHSLLALDALPESSEIRDRLNDISNISTQTITEVREISHNLRPYHLDKLGLTTSIQSIIRRMSEASGITFTSDIDAIDELFSKDEEVHVFRIIQEAVNNIVKHSQAAEAYVSVKQHDKLVKVIVRDNGKGFTTPRTSLPTPDDELHGFGLIGLGERVRILNGNISYGSTPGRGTTMIVDIPYRRRDHA